MEPCSLQASLLLVLLVPLHAAIEGVGFRNRYYRGYGYTGSRVLEHNETGRFTSYVEAIWTQAAAVDTYGRVWIADRHRHQILLVDAQTRYVPWPAYYTDYAGIRAEPGHFDGSRLQARFDNPMGIVVSETADQGLLIYVADTNNHCIRRLDYAKGRTSTIVGNPLSPGLRDGPGVESHFHAPMSLGIDSTGRRLFVLDNVRQIRYIDLSQPIPQVSTLVGGACRAVSRELVVSSVIVRRVGCHADWIASQSGSGSDVVQIYEKNAVCVGHIATCNPRHHPGIADARAAIRFEMPVQG